MAQLKKIENVITLKQAEEATYPLHGADDPIAVFAEFHTGARQVESTAQYWLYVRQKGVVVEDKNRNIASKDLREVEVDGHLVADLMHHEVNTTEE